MSCELLAQATSPFFWCVCMCIHEHTHVCVCACVCVCIVHAWYAPMYVGWRVICPTYINVCVLCVYKCVCVLMYVYRDMHPCMCVCISITEAEFGYFLFFFLNWKGYFVSWDQNCPWNVELENWARLAGQWAQEILLSLSPQITSTCLHFLLFTWLLRFSRLHAKHFTH